MLCALLFDAMNVSYLPNVYPSSLGFEFLDFAMPCTYERVHTSLSSTLFSFHFLHLFCHPIEQPNNPSCYYSLVSQDPFDYFECSNNDQIPSQIEDDPSCPTAAETAASTILYTQQTCPANMWGRFPFTRSWICFRCCSCIWTHAFLASCVSGT